MIKANTLEEKVVRIHFLKYFRHGGIYPHAAQCPGIGKCVIYAAGKIVLKGVGDISIGQIRFIGNF